MAVPKDGALPFGGASFAAASSGNTIALLGDSRIQQQCISSYNGNAANLPAINFMNWANALNGQRFNVVGNFGNSGDRTDQWLARLPYALATGARFLVLWGLVNDIGQAFPTSGSCVATGVGNIVAAANGALAAGMVPIIFGEPGSTTCTATQVAQVMQANQLLRDFAYNTPGVIYYDAPAVLWNPTGSASAITFRSGYSADGTHTQNSGAYALGADFGAMLAPLVPRFGTEADSILENVGTGSLERLSNPLFTTLTGGSGGAFVTSGTVPAGYGVTQLGGGTVAITSQANASGFGNDLIFTITASAANDGITIHQDSSLANVTGGQFYRGGVGMDVAPGATNFYGAHSVVETNVAGLSYTNYDLYANDTGNGPSGYVGAVLQPPPLAIPATGAINWLTWRVEAWFSGAGSAVVTLRRAWLRQAMSVNFMKIVA